MLIINNNWESSERDEKRSSEGSSVFSLQQKYSLRISRIHLTVKWLSIFLLHRQFGRSVNKSIDVRVGHNHRFRHSALRLGNGDFLTWLMTGCGVWTMECQTAIFKFSIKCYFIIHELQMKPKNNINQLLRPMACQFDAHLVEAAGRGKIQCGGPQWFNGWRSFDNSHSIKTSILSTGLQASVHLWTMPVPSLATCVATNQNVHIRSFCAYRACSTV